MTLSIKIGDGRDHTQQRSFSGPLWVPVRRCSPDDQHTSEVCFRCLGLSTPRVLWSAPPPRCLAKDIHARHLFFAIRARHFTASMRGVATPPQPPVPDDMQRYYFRPRHHRVGQLSVHSSCWFNVSCLLWPWTQVH